MTNLSKFAVCRLTRNSLVIFLKVKCGPFSTLHFLQAANSKTSLSMKLSSHVSNTYFEQLQITQACIFSRGNSIPVVMALVPPLNTTLQRLCNGSAFCKVTLALPSR